MYGPAATSVRSSGVLAGAGRTRHRDGHAHGSERLDGNAFTIVAAASLVLALNQTAQSLVGATVGVWFENFATALWRTFCMAFGILLAAVRARDRHPEPGREQYVSVVGAVLIAALIGSLALEVHFLLGVVILLAAAWAYQYPSPASRTAVVTVVVASWVLGAFIYEPEPWPRPLVAMAQDIVRFSFIGGLVAAAWLYTRTEAHHTAAIARCAIDSARMDEQTAEARLQMLEAQIEPHFLFNTLAHVKRLYETDPAAGTRMLRNLEAYLTVALPQMRATGSTLGRELEHARAYLDIQQIRMGRRLAYAIDVEPALRGAPLPSLMLLTLVENAIKHGLSPEPAGGRIDIRARGQAGTLRVEVADTGGGFKQSGGQGAGLANIRARLSTQFGAEASLALALNSPSGVVASLVVPWTPPTGTAAMP